MNIAVCEALCLLLSLTVVLACLIILHNKQISLISVLLFIFFFPPLAAFSFLFTYGEFLWKFLFLEGDKFFNLLGAFI